MYERYLVTGATGNLGQAVIEHLLSCGKRVRALVMPHDSAREHIPPEVDVRFGNVTDARTLDGFFEGDLTHSCLIHCAGVVSIATTPPKYLYDVNVNGTKNILSLSLSAGIARLVYVSSVHAIPNKKGKVIVESDFGTSKKVQGRYAQSKVEATSLVYEAAKKGLDACVVFPSGIINPNAVGNDNISSTILSYCSGSLPAAVKGGYDFVDVRDVARGIVDCSDKGKSGEGYILSGGYAPLGEILGFFQKQLNCKKIRYLPLWFVRMLSPFFEGASLAAKKPLFLTPYSAYIIGTKTLFSHARATKEWGYAPRPLTETLNDMLLIFRRRGLV